LQNLGMNQELWGVCFNSVSDCNIKGALSETKHPTQTIILLDLSNSNTIYVPYTVQVTVVGALSCNI